MQVETTADVTFKKTNAYIYLAPHDSVTAAGSGLYRIPSENANFNLQDPTSLAYDQLVYSEIGFDRPRRPRHLAVLFFLFFFIRLTIYRAFGGVICTASYTGRGCCCVERIRAQKKRERERKREKKGKCPRNAASALEIQFFFFFTHNTLAVI